ncbi:MAG: UDP-glucose 4-epimerase GalE [Nitratireductor sp.]|nr:UDP-glucose 4-epimerase GalE [Nitratireductor sp.]
MLPPQNVLIVGGAGYIGSHVALTLLRQGIQTTIADNLSTSDEAVVATLRQFGANRLRFVKADMLSKRQLAELYSSTKPDVTIHLAGLKQVAESFAEPGRYHRTNVGGLANVLAAMDESGCRQMVFSSSASVYGNPEYLPMDEKHPTAPLSPYGESKLKCEGLLKQWASGGSGRRCAVLRYFNPVGCDPYLRMHRTHCPAAQPSLADTIAQVASGRLGQLEVFGSDYHTADGTCVRDFVHISDIAEAHLSALEMLSTMREEHAILNLGSGKGTTVLQLVAAFEATSGIAIPHRFRPRRQGDVPESWADISSARERMNWEPRYSREDICRAIRPVGSGEAISRLLPPLPPASVREQPAHL